MSHNDNDTRDNRNPDEIESDIRQTRSHLDETLSDLQQMFDPQTVVNSAYDYVRRGGANEFASNLGRTIKQNPVPALLIGIGVGWLMFASNRSSTATRDSSRNLPVPLDQTSSTTPTTSTPKTASTPTTATTAASTTAASHGPSVADPAGNSVADPSIVASPGTNEHVRTDAAGSRDDGRTGAGNSSNRELKDDFLEPSSVRDGKRDKR
ncbi:hypothetical protein GCM10027040_10280 [Halomonas shantousis]